MKQITLATRLGVHENTVSRWERGVARPTLRQEMGICEVLRASREELGLGESRPGASRVSLVSAPAVATAANAEPDVRRREFFFRDAQGFGGAVAFAELDWLEGEVGMSVRRALRFASKAEGSNVGSETLSQIQDSIRRLARAYPQESLGVLLGDLIEIQDVTFTLLEGHQRPAQTRDLYVMAGVASGMLSKASHDLGDSQSALAHARTAYVCADNAGHDGLRAWVRGLQSLVAYWAGWTHSAVEYAQHGAELGHGTGTVTAWLPALEARAHAALGDVAATVSALERAEKARDQVTTDDLDQLGGILSFARPRQLYYAADAMVWLAGEEARTEHHARQALDAYASVAQNERSFSDEAGAQADLAVARVAQGDLEGATQALASVVSLPAGLRIHGIVSSVQRVHTALRAPQFQGSAAARTAQEEIEEFCRVPAATAAALLR
jgi:transcriptional regulator with XRE-family HTH domain